jgi:hypothetical protein
MSARRLSWKFVRLVRRGLAASGVRVEELPRLVAQGFDDETHRGAHRAIRSHDRPDDALGPHPHQRPRDEPVLAVASRESGQDRDPVTRGDQRLDDRVVDQALDAMRLVTGDRLDALQDAVEREAVRVADPVLADDIGRRQLGFRGERMPVRQHDVERFAHQLDRHEMALPPARQHAGRVGDHDVVVHGEVGEVGEQRVLIGADDPQTGHVGDAAQEAGQQHLAAGREEGDRDLPPRLLDELRPRGLRPLQGDGDVLGRLGEGVAGGGEGDAPSRALRERHTGLPLQGLQLLRYGRRREVQRLGDGGHAAAFGEFAQQLESTDIHATIVTGCS